MLPDSKRGKTMADRKKYYFEVAHENGLINKETNLTKSQAKALHDYHVKNMVVLKVKRVSYGLKQG